MIAIIKRQQPETSFRRLVPIRGPILALALIALSYGSAGADDAEIAQLLKDKGADITESGGVVTGLAVKDGSNLTDDDFLQFDKTWKPVELEEVN